MKTLHFGIEIETVGTGREALARAIHSVVGGTLSTTGREWAVQGQDGRTWRVVPDGSLSGGEYASGEIVSPILGYPDIERLQEVVRAVRMAGARADASTGIHIHVGAQAFDAKAIANLAKMVRKQERLIHAALGVSEARLGRYCKPIEQGFIERLEAERPKTLQDVSRAWYGYACAIPERYHQSRYHGLNLNSLFFRGTVEFRYFQGTLHAGEVKAYLQFCLALAARAQKARTASSKVRPFDRATARYDFRCFLLSLGLIGEEFKTARFHLQKRLQGSSAWKHGRPQRAQPAPVVLPQAVEGEGAPPQPQPLAA